MSGFCSVAETSCYRYSERDVDLQKVQEDTNQPIEQCKQSEPKYFYKLKEEFYLDQYEKSEIGKRPEFK